MADPTTWPLWSLIATFLAATGLIFGAGRRLAEFADRLADRTGLGEAAMGAIFLGVSTSLSGITASVTAALDGFPALAVSNALGGIAVQTAFLAIADLAYRKANLEHAAASLTNMLSTTLLIVLLAFVMTLTISPPLAVAHVHVGTPLLFVVYGFGLYLILHSVQRPMWRPRMTDETIADRPRPAAERTSVGRLWLRFAAFALLVLIGGMAVARSGGALAARTGISQTVMGGLFVAIATSLPELVTTVAAVRRGALTLAVSDIVGGNAFDVLFICVADVAYLRGPIYAQAGREGTFLGGLAILVNAILLLGLLQRQKRGIANIGFESVAILVVYAAGFLAISLGL